MEVKESAELINIDFRSVMSILPHALSGRYVDSTDEQLRELLTLQENELIRFANDAFQKGVEYGMSKGRVSNG